ncbi:MAG: ABC transporter ATP-binding protein [Acidimicrobiales bacterium]
MREMVIWRAPGGPRPEPEPLPLREVLSVTTEVVRLAWTSDRLRFVVAIGLDLVGATVEVAQVIGSRGVMEAVVEGARPRSQVRRLVLLAGLNAVSVANDNLRSFLINGVTEVATRHAEGRLLEMVAGLELADVEDPDLQDRLQRAFRGAGRLGPHLRSTLEAPAAAAGVATAIVTMTSADVALVPLAAAGVVPRWLLLRRAHDPTRALSARSRGGRETAILRNILTGAQAAHEVRAFDASAFLRARYDELQDEASAAVADLHRKAARRSAWATLAGRAASAPSVARMVLRVARKETSLSDAVASGLARNRLAKSSDRLVNLAAVLRRSGALVADYTTFRPDHDPPTAIGPAPPRDFERIAIEGLRFAYPGASRPVLDGVDMEIRRGEVVALVGENGCGKTTLAKLTCCLYQPSGGRIRWDDVELATCDPRAVRAQIAVVFQDFAQYPMLSAADNIGIGMPDRIMDREAIVHAARQAGAHDIIIALPDGYDTKLSRQFGGVDLSTGQWQRVALARAFLRDAPLVVLDEPTAALDPRAERDLFEAVGALYRSRSALLISHRLSSVRFADRICVLDHGRITESGSHDELISAKGTYAELFEIQARSYR